MDYKDVRIGNWINEQGLHLQVGMINSEVLKTSEPIPLTEDWLIRFGFDKHIRTKGNNPIANYSDNKWNFIDEYVDGTFFIDDIGMEIKYVHKLQNLIYETSGQELVLK